MEAIITGALRVDEDLDWGKSLDDILRDALLGCGRENEDWQIYPAHLFQLRIMDSFESLKASIYLKACIKMYKGLDIELALGIGNMKVPSGRDTIPQAVRFSQQAFKKMQRSKQSIWIKTGDKERDRELNLYIQLALIPMDSWPYGVAEYVKTYLQTFGEKQKVLGDMLGISQSSVSERKGRSNLPEILEVNKRFIELMSPA